MDKKYDLSVELCGVKLDNPVIPASGTFGFGREHNEFYDINILGSISIKGTTREARFGNPTPRIAECRAGLINSVGLQNPGVDAVVARELPELRKIFHKPIVANISGFSIDEYAECCAKIDKEDQVAIIEVNVSCPNVHNGGMSFGTQPEMAAEVTRAVKAVTTKPVFIKLSPNVTDIVAIAKACEEAGADGICLINTLLGMRIDTKRRRPVIDGWLFGSCRIPRGRAYGLSGVARLLYSRDGLRWCGECCRRNRDDDGRCYGRAGGCRQSERSLRLQAHHRGSALRDGASGH